MFTRYFLHHLKCLGIISHDSSLCQGAAYVQRYYRLDQPTLAMFCLCYSIRDKIIVSPILPTAVKSRVPFELHVI